MEVGLLSSFIGIILSNIVNDLELVFGVMLILQATSLSDFYEICKGLELARNFQFPVLREVSCP